MNKLIRSFNQNNRIIVDVILGIAFIIIIIQVVNSFVKNREIVAEVNITEDENIQSSVGITSEDSAVTGGTVSTTVQQSAKTTISAFVDKCLENNLAEAYDMLTDECKEEMYPNIEDFKIGYRDYLFNIYNKVSMENWFGYTYKVEFAQDIMATGNINSDKKQDYITIVRDGDEYKLNINSYIGRTTLGTVTESNDVKITVLSKDTYMNTERYNIEVENNTGNTILLDNRENTKSIYLLDDNSNKYYANTTKIIDDYLLIDDKFKSNFEIEFYSPLSSEKIITNIVFSKLILNNEEYLENKLEYETYSFVAKAY